MKYYVTILILAVGFIFLPLSCAISQDISPAVEKILPSGWKITSFIDEKGNFVFCSADKNFFEETTAGKRTNNVGFLLAQNLLSSVLTIIEPKDTFHPDIADEFDAVISVDGKDSHASGSKLNNGTSLGFILPYDPKFYESIMAGYFIEYRIPKKDDTLWFKFGLTGSREALTELLSCVVASAQGLNH